MSDIISRLKEQLDNKKLRFTKKPILIGGMAMEYYGMRKAGADIDLVVSDEDYRPLARKYPENIKDIHGDLGVILEPFEIWRSIMHLDYNFYLNGAIDEGVVCVVSLDRLLLTRVFAMDAPKYMKDLRLIKDHYLKTFSNKEYQ
jgi:hypothetical protein